MDKFTVRTADGSVDVTASTQAYSTALNDWVAKNEVDVSKIESAVETVFDRHTGRFPMPALVSAAVTELGASPDQFKALSTRVHTYVRSQVDSGRLAVTKGQKGGVSRVTRPGEPIVDKPNV